MFSVLSDRAPWDLKATYAFRIYDYNNDSVICTKDIKRIVKSLTGMLIDINFVTFWIIFFIVSMCTRNFTALNIGNINGWVTKHYTLILQSTVAH